jgi:hypothetical protein
MILILNTDNTKKFTINMIIQNMCSMRLRNLISNNTRNFDVISHRF